MIKKAVFSLAFIALAAMVAVPAVAGGGGGGSKGSVPVRIKNVGIDPVAVNAVSGSATTQQLFQGARVVSANGVTQFSVQSGPFTAVAADPDQPLVINRVRSFNTRSFKTIYLWAEQDTTAATLVGAPGGVKF
jgi:hypothetical protein